MTPTGSNWPAGIASESHPADMPLKVFVDARLAVRGLGISSATRRLIAALESDRAISVHLNASPHGWTRRGKFHSALLSGLLDLSPRTDPRTSAYDVVHYLGNTAPQFPSRTTVITVHDLMSLRRVDRKSRIYQTLLVPGLLRSNKALVVAISRQTADDLVAIIPNISGRLTVIPHGHREGLFSAQERRHILMFGGQGDPRKRIELGLAAYSRYAEIAGAGALPLVLAGRAGLDDRLVAKCVSNGRWSIHADPSELQVNQLLESAACLLYPSAEEGFGLPVIEAGEVGTPVLYDRTARIPAEPLGCHALGVEGVDLELWARAIQAAVDIGPVPNALAHLPTWSEVARAYTKVYRVAERSG